MMNFLVNYGEVLFLKLLPDEAMLTYHQHIWDEMQNCGTVINCTYIHAHVTQIVKVDSLIAKWPKSFHFVLSFLGKLKKYYYYLSVLLLYFI